VKVDDMEARIRSVCLVVLTVIAVAAAIYWLKPVLIPFVLAVFVVLLLSPVIDLQIKYLRMPQPLALVTTLLLVIVLFGAVALLVTTSINQLAANAGAYEQQVSLLLERASEKLPDGIERLVPEGDLKTLVRIPTSTIGAFLARTTNAILGLVSQSFVVFIFVMFLLLGGGGWARQETGTVAEVLGSIRRFLVVMAGISSATGLLVGSTLMLLDVPLAIVFGLLAFMLNFIPTMGSVIATLLPLPVVIISPEISTTTAVLAIGVPAVIQLVVGNIIAPKVMGDSLDLHPVAILMALIFWGMLWGIVGMLLAAPITGVIKLLLSKIPSMKPAAEIMAGRISRESPTVFAEPG
jgi:AI-2 transport protein TqsA